jgi:hypothetical protein
MDKAPRERYSKEETQRRFEAALRGARIVGHKPQSEMKLGKPRGKKSASLTRKKLQIHGGGQP